MTRLAALVALGLGACWRAAPPPAPVIATTAAMREHARCYVGEANLRGRAEFYTKDVMVVLRRTFRTDGTVIDDITEWGAVDEYSEYGALHVTLVERPVGETFSFEGSWTTSIRPPRPLRGTGTMSGHAPERARSWEWSATSEGGVVLRATYETTPRGLRVYRIAEGGEAEISLRWARTSPSKVGFEMEHFDCAEYGTMTATRPSRDRLRKS